MPLQRNTILEQFMLGLQSEQQRQQQAFQNKRAEDEFALREAQHAQALKQIAEQEKRQREQDELLKKSTELNRTATFQKLRDDAIENFYSKGIIPAGAQQLVGSSPGVDSHGAPLAAAEETYALPEAFGPNAQMTVQNRVRYAKEQADLARIGLAPKIEGELEKLGLKGEIDSRIKSEMERLRQQNRVELRGKDMDLAEFKVSSNARLKKELQAEVFKHDFDMNRDENKYKMAELDRMQQDDLALLAKKHEYALGEILQREDMPLKPSEFAVLREIFPTITTDTTISEFRKMGAAPMIKLSEDQTRTLQDLEEVERLYLKLSAKLLQKDRNSGQPILDKYFSGGESLVGSIKTLADIYALRDPDLADVSVWTQNINDAFKNFKNYGGALPRLEADRLNRAAINESRYQSRAEVESKMTELQEIIQSARAAIYAHAGNRMVAPNAGRISPAGVGGSFSLDDIRNPR